jgi:hypothetical protein
MGKARAQPQGEVVLHNDNDMWLFVMLPDAGPVSTASLRLLSLPSYLSLS